MRIISFFIIWAFRRGGSTITHRRSEQPIL